MRVVTVIRVWEEGGLTLLSHLEAEQPIVSEELLCLKSLTSASASAHNCRSANTHTTQKNARDKLHRIGFWRANSTIWFPRLTLVQRGLSTFQPFVTDVLTTQVVDPFLLDVPPLRQVLNYHAWLG